MTSEQELIKRFNEMDKDGNGFLSHDEITAAYKKCGFNDQFIQGYIKTFDTDMDGHVSFDEFKAKLHLIPQNEQRYSAARRLFNEIDKDGSGKVSAEELHRMLNKDAGRKTEISELQSWIAARDTDGDGELNYEEFLEFLRHQK